MTLSNATHNPSGKTPSLTGKHVAPATGLEFLTGETEGGAEAQPKQGVSFAALVQTIARSVLPVVRKTDAVADAAALAAPQTPVDAGMADPALLTEKPDNPVALLAIALQGGKRVDQAPKAETREAPKTKSRDMSPVGKTVVENGSAPSEKLGLFSQIPSEPVLTTKTPVEKPLHHDGKHVAKRAHDGKQRISGDSGAVPPAEPVATPAPVAEADKAEPLAGNAPSVVVGSDKPDQAALLNVGMQQPVAPVAAPTVSEGKSPERIVVTDTQAPVVTSTMAAAVDSSREVPVTGSFAVDQPEPELPAIAHQPVAPVAAPTVPEGKSPERIAVTDKQAHIVSGTVASAVDNKVNVLVTEDLGVSHPEANNIRKNMPEAIESAQAADLDNIQKKSQIPLSNNIKSNVFSENAPIPAASESVPIPIESKADVKAAPELRSARTMATADHMQAVPGLQVKDGPKAEITKADAPEADTKDIQPARNDQAPVARTDTAVREAPQPQSQPQFTPVAQPATLTTNLTSALTSQVIDMAVSGQWIDDIARQIASIGANPGHGSFRIESQAMGAVRVDIAPSVYGAGSDVLMRVDNDAAFAALDKDRDRLVQDARMSSVRIGELRIDRLAPAQETQGGGSATSQQQGSNAGQQGGQQTMNQTNAQAGGQGGNQPGRQDAAAMGGQRDGQNSPKAPFTNAVMNGAERDDAARTSRSGHGDNARYA